MENLQYYIKKFENAVAILLVGVLASIYMAVNLVGPKFQDMTRVLGDTHKQKKLISDTRRKINDAKMREAQQQDGPQKTLKAFYRPIDSGADSETIMSKELGDVLAILTRNKVKTRAIKYSYEPQQDQFIKFAVNKYSACMLDIDLVADYRTFLNFLRDLYKHEYFININRVEIVPYRKNNRILLINLQLTLYAQKDNSHTEMPGL